MAERLFPNPWKPVPYRRMEIEDLLPGEFSEAYVDLLNDVHAAALGFGSVEGLVADTAKVNAAIDELTFVAFEVRRTKTAIQCQLPESAVPLLKLLKLAGCKQVGVVVLPKRARDIDTVQAGLTAQELKTLAYGCDASQLARHQAIAAQHGQGLFKAESSQDAIATVCGVSGRTLKRQIDKCRDESVPVTGTSMATEGGPATSLETSKLSAQETPNKTEPGLAATLTEDKGEAAAQVTTTLPAEAPEASAAPVEQAETTHVKGNDHADHPDSEKDSSAATRNQFTLDFG